MSYAIATDRPGEHGFVRDGEGEIFTLPTWQSALDCAKFQRIRFPGFTFEPGDRPMVDPMDVGRRSPR